MIKDISILGCGWLGKPLSERLISNGYNVKGSVTDKKKFSKLESLGIKPYYINLNPSINEDYDLEFFDSSILMICLPSKETDDFHKTLTSQIETIINIIHRSPIQQVFFFSSKEVYARNNTTVNESQGLFPISNAGKALLNAELLLQQQVDFSTTVFRLADVFDDNKLLSLWPESKKKKAKPIISEMAHLDFIHLEDCINIILLLLEERRKKNEVFNICTSQKVKRVDLLKKIAWKKGLDTPKIKSTKAKSFVLMNNSKIKKFLQYKFIYDEPFKRKI